MNLDYETLRKFARENGDLKIYGPKGQALIRKEATGDIFSVIATATTFVFDGKEYSRADFEKFLSQRQSNK